MFPIRDHNPSGRTPYVTYALIVINVVVFLSYVGLFENPRALNAFFFDWAILPARITHGDGLETLVTSMFLHGGWMHIAGNMLFLWIFGDNLEDEMGHLGFLAFYLAAGIGAGLVHVLSAPGSLVPTVGASGAIAGVMGGYLLLFPKAKIDIIAIFIIFFKIFTIPAWIMLAIWFAIQFFGGIAADANAGGVAYWAHAGGFVVGAILTLPVFLRRGGKSYWDENEFHPPHPDAVYDPSDIPTIRRRRR
ncbi:rhomboid family intramembrane serine protease [Alisedimentitalea sp. MJ-SS2]|uniref:rhomboid family intramembrane serine protease n=1 Tax=Aliisedimentitalea sp. MJ-SS2 TaxID=3049795 RepID=UPI00290647AE|nr:rhomboid family intramembrane serine protease [Alisedimentitalea sp. MJ-SS2]MDU8927245.1 rhomboid family intramembrane serine protease [Alisedimentitalea sp. MJ-SS2]